MVVTYSPFVCEISNIAPGQETVITTSINHEFVVGNQVRIFMPPRWGMAEIDGKTGLILAVTGDTLTVNIDSLNFTPFTTPANITDYPQVIPVGDQNTGYTIQNGEQPAQLVIPGSFKASLN